MFLEDENLDKELKISVIGQQYHNYMLKRNL